MTRILKLDTRDKVILKLRKQGLTLGDIKIILKEKHGIILSRERIDQIVKGRATKSQKVD